jgi:hypothetical protein
MQTQFIKYVIHIQIGEDQCFLMTQMSTFNKESAEFCCRQFNESPRHMPDLERPLNKGFKAVILEIPMRTSFLRRTIDDVQEQIENLQYQLDLNAYQDANALKTSL